MSVGLVSAALCPSEQAPGCGHLPVCGGEGMGKALPAERWSQIKNVFGNLSRMPVMFPAGKRPDHWVDVKRKCLCGEGREGIGMRIQRVLMNTITRKRKGGITMLNNENEGWQITLT